MKSRTSKSSVHLTPSRIWRRTPDSGLLFQLHEYYGEVAFPGEGKARHSLIFMNYHDGVMIEDTFGYREAVSASGAKTIDVGKSISFFANCSGLREC